MVRRTKMTVPIRTVDEARRVCNFPAEGRAFVGEATSGDDPDSRKGYWVGERPALVRWAGSSFDGRFDTRGPYSWWQVRSYADGTGLVMEFRPDVGGSVYRRPLTAAELVARFGPATADAPRVP
jgi:hypothetical protein